jgi:hypothetical protein
MRLYHHGELTPSYQRISVEGLEMNPVGTFETHRPEAAVFRILKNECADEM